MQLQYSYTVIYNKLNSEVNCGAIASDKLASNGLVRWCLLACCSQWAMGYNGRWAMGYSLFEERMKICPRTKILIAMCQVVHTFKNILQNC